MNSHIALALALAGALAAPTVPAQTCNPAIRPSAPDARFIVDSNKGTVLDTKTGLIWKRCPEGRSGAHCDLGNAVYLTWGEALRRAEASSFAGHKDWRLPNSKELESLVEVACNFPALNENVFPHDATAVWASSPSAYSANSAWVVHFQDGDSYSDALRYVDYAVRLVRGGQ